MSVRRGSAVKLAIVGVLALGLGGCGSEGNAGPGDDGGTLAPFCNADLEASSQSGVIGLRYPATIIRGITVGERDTTWVGTQRAATPVDNPDCPARFATTPPGPPCSTDSQVDLGGSLLTVGVPFADLAAIPTGQEVHVRARSGFNFGAAASEGNVLVEINRKRDGAPLLVAGAFTYDAALLAPPWTFGYLRLRLDTPVCRNRQLDTCRRSFLSKALAVDGPDRTVRLEPGESAEFVTLDGRYRVTLRGLVERGGGEGAECSDYQPPRASFEIVRLGD